MPPVPHSQAVEKDRPALLCVEALIDLASE
jgi:hypothetical protein